jgi:hypothetical protein
LSPRPAYGPVHRPLQDQVGLSNGVPQAGSRMVGDLADGAVDDTDLMTGPSGSRSPASWWQQAVLPWASLRDVTLKRLSVTSPTGSDARPKGLSVSSPTVSGSRTCTPTLIQWAGRVTAKSHVDRVERERREIIPPDVMDRAFAYASPAVLAELQVMTTLRDRDPASFVTSDERRSESWEMRACFRRSEYLRREAGILRALIRNELGEDPFMPRVRAPVKTRIFESKLGGVHRPGGGTMTPPGSAGSGPSATWPLVGHGVTNLDRTPRHSAREEAR